MLLQPVKKYQIYGQQRRTLVSPNLTNIIFVVSRKFEAVQKWCEGGGKTDSSSWLDICYPSREKYFLDLKMKHKAMENVLTQAVVQQKNQCY